MHVALVKNSEDHIHHEYRADDQKRQRAEELLKDQRFTLESDCSPVTDWRQYLGDRSSGCIHHIAERLIGFNIEPEGHARELIEVIDRLQSEVLLRFRDRTQSEIDASIAVVSGLVVTLVIASRARTYRFCGLVARSLSSASTMT